MITAHRIEDEAFVSFEHVADLTRVVHRELQAVLVEFHAGARALSIEGQRGARRIGKIRDSWSDEISVENILARWEAGHILCVDDLDAWYEVSKDGTQHFFYEGGERPVEEMRAIAEQIVAAVEAEEIEAHWQYEPSVHVG